MDEANYQSENFKLYEVNSKGLPSSTTSPQSTIHPMDFAWLKEPLLAIRISRVIECVNLKMGL